MNGVEINLFDIFGGYIFTLLISVTVFKPHHATSNFQLGSSGYLCQVFVTQQLKYHIPTRFDYEDSMIKHHLSIKSLSACLSVNRLLMSLMGSIQSGTIFLI